MTEFTNTRERRPGEPTDSVSHAGDFQPNSRGRRTRRRRRYLFVVIPAMLLTLAVLLSSSVSCTMIGAYSGISFDLTSVLAHASMPADVHACVQSSCVSFTVEQWGTGGGVVCFADSCRRGRTWGKGYKIHAPPAEMHSWDGGFPVMQVYDPSLSWLPVTVRLNVTDQTGNLIFDSSTRVQAHIHQPNGPNCEPTVYQGSVVAMRTGRLVAQT